jgi:hypothetical protein
MPLLSRLLITLAVSTALQPSRDLSRTIITGDVSYRRPLVACELPDIALLIARAVGVPAGVERVPGPCQPPRRDPNDTGERERVFLAGTTVGDAMKALLALDPQYRWVDADGVLLVRPVSAWGNTDHFLHSILSTLSIDNEHMRGALDSWRSSVTGEPIHESMHHGDMRTAEGNRRFTITPGGAISAIDALDAIVRAHGSLSWEVSYCKPSTERRYATVWLRTLKHNGERIGAPFREQFETIDGKTIDHCR